MLSKIIPTNPKSSPSMLVVLAGFRDSDLGVQAQLIFLQLPHCQKSAWKNPPLVSAAASPILAPPVVFPMARDSWSLGGALLLMVSVCLALSVASFNCTCSPINRRGLIRCVEAKYSLSFSGSSGSWRTFTLVMLASSCWCHFLLCSYFSLSLVVCFFFTLVCSV